MSNWRKVWEEHNGPIPKGMHIHHIIPRSEGGTDDIDNLQLVTPEEHYDIHFERGDYGACALISDGIEREAPTIAVVAFDLHGNKVKHFNSQTEAVEWLHETTHIKSVNPIAICCQYKAKSVGGYQWFYYSEVGDVDYVGPVERKSNNGGHNTSMNNLYDLVEMEPIKSKCEGARRLGVKTTPGNSTFKSKEFTDRFIPITKEEYKILKQLENE